VVALVLVACWWVPGSAGATFTFPPGSPLSSANESFLSGFPNSCGNAPFPTPNSLLNDGTHIFVATICENQKLYRFPASGGAVGGPGVIGNVTGNANGLALDNGTYFSTGSAFCCGEVPGVYTFDPGTLTRASSPVTPGSGFNHNNAAVDPQSGDLYFGNDNIIRRIQNPASGSPTVSQFVDAGVNPVDDLKWTADGSRLYAATQNSMQGFDRAGNVKVSVDLSAHGNGGCCAAVGIALDQTGNVFVTAADGTIERVDVHNANTVSTVASNGNPANHGELRHTGTGPDGCLLVPQQGAVTKFAPCIFQPDVQGGAKLAPPPSGGGPAPPGGTPLNSDPLTIILDTNSIEFKVLLRKGIIVDARCNRACQTTASLLAAQGAFRSSKARRGPRPTVLARASFKLTHAGRGKLRLRLTSKGRRLLSKGHKGRAVVTLKVVTKALTPPFTTVTKTRRITVKRGR